MLSARCKYKITSYRFITLQHSKSEKSFFKQTGNCCSTIHALTGLLHKLKRHYHVHRSFQHLPMKGQMNPVHISHSIYIIPTFKKFSDIGKRYQYICLISLTLPIITSMLEIITLTLLKLRSKFNTKIKRNFPSLYFRPYKASQ